MGFVNTPELMALLENTSKLSAVDPDEYDAIAVARKVAPMFTYRDSFVGHTLMPFGVEDALKERGANYIQGGPFQGLHRPRRQADHRASAVLRREVAQLLIDLLGI